MRELVKAYDEYIDLLTIEAEGLYGLAFTHGYNCPEERVKRGAELRAKIDHLKSELGI